MSEAVYTVLYLSSCSADLCGTQPVPAMHMHICPPPYAFLLFLSAVGDVFALPPSVREHLLALTKLNHHVRNLHVLLGRVLGSDLEDDVLLMLWNLLLRDVLNESRESA